MATISYFTCKAGHENTSLKTLKFKVQKQSDCVRLLQLIKSKNSIVIGAALMFELSSGKVYKWRFNPHWYKMTGNLIPILKDVKCSMYINNK